MLTRVAARAAAQGTGRVRGDGADRTGPGASDAFSRQLLSILQNGLERLGAAPACVKTARSETRTAEATAKESPQRQFFVTAATGETNQAVAGASTCEADEGAPPAVAEAPGGCAMPDVLFEQHNGWNWRNYATYEMAQWLATRLGGEVGTYEADWSPGFEPPPTYYTVRFGDIEMNAGQLAVYYQPGDYVEPDRMAAMLMAGEGVNNSFVAEHFPELSQA